MTKDYPLSSKLVLEASSRILEMGYPNDLSEEELKKRVMADAALCAADVQARYAEEQP